MPNLMVLSWECISIICWTDAITISEIPFIFLPSKLLSSGPSYFLFLQRICITGATAAITITTTTITVIDMHKMRVCIFNFIIRVSNLRTKMKERAEDEINVIEPCRNVFSAYIEEHQPVSNPFNISSPIIQEDPSPPVVPVVSDHPPQINRLPYINSPDVTLLKKPPSKITELIMLQKYAHSAMKSDIDQCSLSKKETDSSKKKDVSKDQHLTTNCNITLNSHTEELSNSKINTIQVDDDHRRPICGKQSCCVIY